jgi:hypothetical protein
MLALADETRGRSIRPWRGRGSLAAPGDPFHERRFSGGPSGVAGADEADDGIPLQSKHGGRFEKPPRHAQYFPNRPEAYSE